MKTAKKSKKIYEKIRRDILRHNYAPGAQLPHETDFAKELGISRDTLRSALARLEEESLIHRVKGAGTFISKNITRKKITFLLPCPESVNSYSRTINQVFQGVLEEAKLCRCDVETLVASQTNRIEDIDFEAFFNVNSESRVIITGAWFREVFPFLLESKCHVSLIFDSRSLEPEIMRKLESWNLLEKCVYENAEKMTQRLMSIPCKNPGFFLRFLTKSGSLQDVITEYCRTHFPEANLYFLEVPRHVAEAEVAAFCRNIEPVLKNNAFDGFMINDYQVYHTIRRFYPDLPCAYIDLMIQTDRSGDRNVFHSYFDLENIGREAVRCLINNEKPVKKQFFSSISDYNPQRDGFFAESWAAPEMEFACLE